MLFYSFFVDFFVPCAFANIVTFLPAYEFCAPFEQVVYCQPHECRDLIRTYGYRDHDQFVKSIPAGFSSFVCYNPYFF